MNSFELLRNEIQTYIWEQNWPKLRPIQEASIKHFKESDNNLILAAPTASGKTEAAFLPTINAIDSWHTGVKILYISPLIALINDQFKRVSELCEYLNVPVTSWHGEASQSKKKKLIKNPRGIVLITPESIESALIRSTGTSQSIFSDIEYVVVDEVHSFLDSSRVVHLQALLSRINSLSKNSIRHIGLSATLSRGSYDLAKLFFGKNKNTNVLADSSKNKLTITHSHNENIGSTVSSVTIDDIYKKSLNERMLVFPNSRRAVEDIAVRLEKRAKKSNSHVRYFSHHASVDKELRLEAELFAKASKDELFTICCTSTLELGIDIGSVDSICQVGAASSVSSLAQRLGRSGRQKQHSILHVYTDKAWVLLQNIATIELLRERNLETIQIIKKPYSVLFQQILSLLMEHNGLTKPALKEELFKMPCWGTITIEEIDLLIESMIAGELIEISENELITGVESERLIERRDFYAHFNTRTEARVMHGSQHIGDMPISNRIKEGKNVYLAARIWKITKIDSQTKKILVVPANDGKPPQYFGDSIATSHLVRQKMQQVLNEIDELPEYVDDRGTAILKDLYQKLDIGFVDGNAIKIQILSTNNIGDKEISIEQLTTFAGTKINDTLLLLLNKDTVTSTSVDEITCDDESSSFVGNHLSKGIDNLLSNPVTEGQIKEWLMSSKKEIEKIKYDDKYTHFLPNDLIVNAFIQNKLDVYGAQDFLKNNYTDSIT